jgi:hypothetical protein
MISNSVLRHADIHDQETDVVKYSALIIQVRLIKRATLITHSLSQSWTKKASVSRTFPAMSVWLVKDPRLDSRPTWTTLYNKAYRWIQTFHDCKYELQQYLIAISYKAIQIDSHVPFQTPALNNI